MNLIITEISTNNWLKNAISRHNDLSDILVDQVLSNSIIKYGLSISTSELLAILKRDGVYCYVERNKQLVIVLDLINQ